MYTSLPLWFLVGGVFFWNFNFSAIFSVALSIAFCFLGCFMINKCQIKNFSFLIFTFLGFVFEF